MKKENFLKLTSRHRGSTHLLTLTTTLKFSEDELDLLYSHIKAQTPFLKKYEYLLKK